MPPPDPILALAPTDIASIIGEAAKGLPLIGVMWYMLRDLRSRVTDISSKVGALELKVASDNSHVRIEHTNEKLKEFKEESRNELDKVQKRLTLLENQMPALWAVVGNRPEDIERRKERK